MLNNIRVSETADEVILNVNVIANLGEIMDEIESKIPKLKEICAEKELPIRITGRLFTDTEIDKVKKLILSNMAAEIKFDDISDILGLHAIKRTYKVDIDISETKFIQYSLRSGQKEEYPGSMVICGDVNSGAEVVAGGNIMIMGALRGLAHAGAHGNTLAMIAANSIDSTQIRIANLVREVTGRTDKCPICKIEKNEIVIR
jgi:septum site-determining protein MinC